ncbi:MAG: response regulator [Planctomycetota bacterium]|jgi:DNA-binding NtrC family response regulator
MNTTKTVLFVDDEVRILRSIKRVVFGQDFKSLFANSGEEALEMLSDHDVQVLVTDMRMPGISGLELLREVKKQSPHIARIVLSGYTQVTTLLTAINQGEILRYIIKPWESEDELLSAIQDGFIFYENALQTHGAVEGH